MPGDVLFLVGGILPIVYLAGRMFINRRRYGEIAPQAAVEKFTE